MDNSKVSVIVPIYNTEKFLQECIESVLNQTYKNIEIILVDNGSTDTSPKICDRFAQQDDRVKFIHKEHGSIASGRNAGIDAATGSHIMFVDSDDVLDINMVQVLYDACSTTGSDISICKAKRLYIDALEEMPQTGKLLLCNSEEAIFRWICEREFGNEVWAKLYNTKCIRDIRFPDMKCEDMCYLFDALQKAEKISIIDNRLYHYRMHRLYNDRSAFRRLVESNKPQVYANIMKVVKNKYPSIYDQVFASCCEDELSSIMKIYAAKKVKEQQDYLYHINLFYENIYDEMLSNEIIKKRRKKLIKLFCKNKSLFNLIFIIRNIVRRKKK